MLLRISNSNGIFSVSCFKKKKFFINECNRPGPAQRGVPVCTCAKEAESRESLCPSLIYKRTGESELGLVLF